MNLPEVLILFNSHQADIIEHLKKSDYLQLSYSIEQQQNWILSLAVQSSLSELTGFILQYYIDNPEQLRVVALDQELFLKLLGTRHPLVLKFMNVINRKQKLP